MIAALFVEKGGHTGTSPTLMHGTSREMRGSTAGPGLLLLTRRVNDGGATGVEDPARRSSEHLATMGAASRLRLPRSESSGEFLSILRPPMLSTLLV